MTRLIIILDELEFECAECGTFMEVSHFDGNFNIFPTLPEQAKLDLMGEIFDDCSEADLLAIRDKYHTPDRPGVKRD